MISVRDAHAMDPPTKITIPDDSIAIESGDQLCQDCYESFAPQRQARPGHLNFEDLQASSQACAGCKILFRFFVDAQRRGNLPNFGSTAAEIRRSWALWVNHCSRSKSPRDADRFVALTRFSSFIQSVKEDEPLLGLWKDDLAEGLLWERGIWEEPAARKRIAPFPSWTWMSLPGPAQYPNFALSKSEIEVLETHISWWNQPITSTLMTAELVLRAKVFKGTLTYRGRESAESSLQIELGESSKMALYERLDIPDSYYENTTVRCILVGCTDTHWFFIIASVVNPERNPYIRIGRAYSPGDSKLSMYNMLAEHFADVEPQILTLR